MPDRLPPRGKPAPKPGEPREEAREPWEQGPPWERGGRAPVDPPLRTPAPPTSPLPSRPAPVTGAGGFDLFARRVAPKPLTVGELTRQIKELLESRFTTVLVQGEVSNLKAPGSGHVYFTLKDGEAALEAVIFKTALLRLKFRPKDGLSVVARGRLSFYNGRTQLVCDGIEPLGAGALQIAFEQLKARLSAEGLFDAGKKRALPFLPRRIAVVTSPTGAAVHDFLRVLHRRFPNLPVVIVPSKVQGEGAAQEIARGIARGAGLPDVDVVVVARGGGSLEDLWAFNEEVVARAIAACPVPTVSAVGHEVDFTIADFVADVRAATPTAAAELLSRVKDELVADVAQRRARLVRAMRTALERRRAQLDGRRARLVHPRAQLAEQRLQLDKLEQRLGDAVREELLGHREDLRGLRGRLELGHPRERLRLLERRIAEERSLLVEAVRAGLGAKRAQLLALTGRVQARDPRDGLHARERELSSLRARLAELARGRLADQRERLGTLAARLDAMSPLKVLGRGYAVAFEAGGRALRSASEVQPGSLVRVRLGAGALETRVLSVQAGDDEKTGGA